MIIKEDITIEIINLIKVIWAPTVIALLSYFISRLNVRIKKVEIQGQAELRARELNFIAYEKKLEKISENTGKLARWITDNSKKLDSIHDKDQRTKKLKIHLEQCKQQIATHYSFFEDLFDEIEIVKFSNQKIDDRVNFVKSIMQTDIDKLPVDEYEKYFREFAKALSISSSLEYDLVDKKRIETFSKYLKK